MAWERRDTWALAALLAWPVWYVLGAATTFQYADSAEFLTVAATGGVAHPPGYPLYTWLGWLAVALWPGMVPTALALLAALLTWGTLAGIYTTARVLGCRPGPALFGASVAGVSYHLWKHATLPEAFALLGCQAAWLCALACIAASDDADIIHRRRAWLGYALLAGLATAHHHTIVLTFPLGVLLLWKLFRDKDISQRPRLFVMGCACFVVGLLPYVHLWWRGSASLIGSWGHIQGFGDVLDHFLRREFGTFQSGLNAGARRWWSHSLGYLGKSLSWRGSFPLGLGGVWLLGMFFAAVAWRRRREKALPFVLDGRVVAIGLTWCLAGLAFPILLKMGTTPLAQTIVARFYLLPDVFLGVFAALGAAWLATLFPGPFERHVARNAALLWLGVAAFLQFPKASAHKRLWLESYARDVLRELPKDALLLEADNEAVCFGMNYLQHVLKLRPDVRFICLPLLARRWYVARLRRRWPDFRYKWRPKRIYSLGIIDHYSRRKRPVHVTTKYSRSMQTRYVWLPFGLTWQLLPPKTKSPSPKDVFVHMQENFKKVQRPWRLPRPGERPWEASVVVRYAMPWYYLAVILEQMKEPALARRCLQVAKRWRVQKSSTP